jgi:AcrR family transcriptional regulator
MSKKTPPAPTSPPPLRRRVRRGNQEDAEQLRQDLLRATLELFAEGGPQALTTRAIAARVGVSQMTAYRYFANKAELVEGVWHQIGLELVTQIRQALQGVEGGRARHRVATAAALNFWEDRPDAFALLFGFTDAGPARRAPPQELQAPDELLALQRELTEDLARDIGGDLARVPMAIAIRTAMQLGYLLDVLTRVRHSRPELSALRSAYIEAVAVATENCLLGGEESKKAPRRAP